MLGVLFSGLAAIIKIAGPVVTSFATQLVAKLPTIVETALKVLKVVFVKAILRKSVTAAASV